ncbi:MAG: Holliday junction resolvase RuvX [Candidatus Kapaibacterium sp.]
MTKLYAKESHVNVSLKPEPTGSGFLFLARLFVQSSTSDMRSLGIDYGTARVGLAISDELGITVRPFGVLKYSKNIVEEILAIVQREGIGLVVVGMPYDLRGNETETTERVQRFAEKLRGMLPCPVVEWDEALSSRKAVERMVEAGVKKSKRREKGTTDSWAAAIILQEYLSS